MDHYRHNMIISPCLWGESGQVLGHHVCPNFVYNHAYSGNRCADMIRDSTVWNYCPTILQWRRKQYEIGGAEGLAHCRR